MKTHTFSPLIFALGLAVLSIIWVSSARAQECDANGSICKSKVQVLLQLTRNTVVDAREKCKAQGSQACKPIYMEADKKCQENWKAYGFEWTPTQTQGDNSATQGTPDASGNTSVQGGFN